MWPKIDTHYLDRDERTWKQTQEMVDLEPNECPYCYKTITPLFIESYMYSPLGLLHMGLPGNTLQSVYRCPNRDCGLIFIASYSEEKAADEKFYYHLSSVGPRHPRPLHELVYSFQNNVATF